MNLNVAETIVRWLSRMGVHEFCVCAGARSSPFVVALSQSSFRTYRFFEERSAGFFALGRAKQTGAPVAIVTTSGTAVAELLPAVIEAHYSGIGLVAVTADRPTRYRGTGAPQTIEQAGMFSSYAVGIDLDASAHTSESFARELAEQILRWRPYRPLHLNIGFDEPLLTGGLGAPFDGLAAPPNADAPPGENHSTRIEEFLEKSSRPFVIVGALEPRERAAVARFLIHTRLPVYLEASSGLREARELQSNSLLSGERIFQSPEFAQSTDAVLRLGGVPTCRLWRDLEGHLEKLPVLSLNCLGFSGLSRGEFYRADLVSSLFGSKVTPREPSSVLLALDRSQAAGLETLLARYPRSEPAWVRRIARGIPSGSRVYLGNSLPIREWDLAAPRDAGQWEIGANRGANGIDGQMSTFFGFAEAGKENWALLGDLTALYDLSAPWILPQIPDTRVHLVVINNGGGKIFERMFSDPAFQNQHSIALSHWAKMWALRYRAGREEFEIAASGVNELLEIFPDTAETAAFWTDHEAFWERGALS